MNADQFSEEIESHDTFTLNIENRNDDQFEFPCVFNETNSRSISADEIFSEGKIRPVFVHLNSDPSLKSVSKPPVKALRRRSLSRLFTEDKDFDQPLCSSSETDGLDGVSRAMYCKWTPHKSNSTGTSKRWKFSSLLRRCQSDSSDGLSFYGHREDNVSVQNFFGKGKTTVLEHYPGKKTENYGDRPRSYLPYKQDLIGLFANILNKPGARKW